jgi:hypothetical protein
MSLSNAIKRNDSVDIFLISGVSTSAILRTSGPTLFGHDESLHLLCHHCVAPLIIDKVVQNLSRIRQFYCFHRYYFLSPSIAMVAMDLSSPGDAPALALTLMPVITDRR